MHNFPANVPLRYQGKIKEKNGKDVVVDMCSKSCETCPNQATCNLLGPWREDLLDTRGLEVGEVLLLWHTPWRNVKYFVLMYGWYALPVLILLLLARSPLSWGFLLGLLPALYLAFRLQCRLFNTRTVRKTLQMKYEPRKT